MSVFEDDMVALLLRDGTSSSSLGFHVDVFLAQLQSLELSVGFCAELEPIDSVGTDIMTMKVFTGWRSPLQS